MKERFTAANFRASSLEVIAKANVILEEYRGQNLVLTLRQLYYQFVARGWLPNQFKEYKRLGSIMSDARLAGLVDWSMMEDRVRSLESIPRWSNPAEIIEATAEQYQEDLWAGQKRRPEVWIEKDALIGVIEGVCHELRVDYFACRGNVSQSAQYEAGKRFACYRRLGQKPIVFHLGDHDPSGLDMTRDNRDRLSLFADDDVEVVRLALNMDQIDQYNPPPNPVKESDSRSDAYTAEYGHESWELDALEPSVIGDLIREHVTPLIDRKKWNARKAEETTGKEQLSEVSQRWTEVLEYLGVADDE